MRNLFFLFFVFLFCSACWQSKAIFLNKPDTKDPKRFLYNEVEASDQPFDFYRSEIDYGEILKINDWTTDLPVFRTIKEKLDDGPTLGFAIIRNDSILYEYYDEGYDASDLFTSYSVAKSFTSALVGIAIDEGHIKGVDQLAMDFIPELKDHVAFQEVSIRHLLNHTSGMAESLSMDGKLYYSNDVMKALSKIKFENKAGETQSYVNMNTQLLGLILWRATGVHPGDYLEEKIWKPMGARYNARWSTDKKNQMEKTYCCLNASLLDYAKFGRLYLNGGNWEGKQLVPASWVEESLARNTEEGSSHSYNYCWHLGLKEYEDYAAAGLFEQYIFVAPKKDIIIVAFNRADSKLEMERVNWLYIMRQLTDLL